MNDDDVDIPLGPSWMGAGGGPTGAAFVALGVGAFLSFSINGLDFVKLGAGGVALLCALLGGLLALRARSVGKILGAAVAGLGALVMLAISGVAGALPIAGLFGPSTDEIRDRIAADEGLTEVSVVDEGGGRFSFTGRRGFDRCSGAMTVSGGFGGESSSVSMECGLPEDLGELEGVCREGSGPACGLAVEQIHDVEPIDWARLRPLLEAGCGLENATSCFYLGVAREYGHAVEVDLSGALRAYRTSCDRGERVGCTNAGVLLLEGRGAQADAAGAVAMFTRGCDRGHLRGCEMLGRHYRDGSGVERDYGRARELFERACEGDDGAGCTNLAALYLDGHVGEASDPARAFELYERGCQHGSTAGCRMTGELIEDGRGVARDPARALAIYVRACEQDDALACVDLGMLRHEGADGVPVDHPAALVAFERACELREQDGCRTAGVYHRDGIAGPPNPERAHQLLAQACELGYEPACRDAQR